MVPPTNCSNSGPVPTLFYDELDYIDGFNVRPGYSYVAYDVSSPANTLPGPNPYPGRESFTPSTIRSTLFFQQAAYKKLRTSRSNPKSRTLSFLKLVYLTTANLGVRAERKHYALTRYLHGAQIRAIRITWLWRLTTLRFTELGTAWGLARVSTQAGHGTVRPPSQ
jgi:hypothetical protein